MMRKYKFDFSKITIVVICCLVVGILLFLTIFHIVTKKYINDVTFNLNGSSLIEMEVGSGWIDPSVLALYDGNSIINNVLINDNVNSNIPGNYEVTYTITKGWNKKTLVRKVIVKERNEHFYITLKGNDVLYVMKGSPYNELGYEAYYNGENVSDNVLIVGNVDTSRVGDNYLKYQVKVDNYFREVTRKVVVVDFSFQISLGNNGEYVKENTINFSSIDDNYYYVLLPDGKIDNSKSITYKIVNNGSYSFVIYNKLGFFLTKNFEINNIDNKSPTGSCVGYLYDNHTKLEFDGNDNYGILEYVYRYGNNSSKVNEGQYVYYEDINNASVDVYDKALNVATFECKMIDKSSTIPSGYNWYTFKDPETSRTMKYWLYIPKNVTKRNPAPLMVYLHGDGSRSDNINKVNGWAYPKFINEGADYPFMMLAGQINYETNWTNAGTYEILMRLVDYVIANYSVNTKKIILAGGSSGGGGVYVITANYPKYFSCAVVGSGIYASGYKKIASQLIYTPMWIFHGTNDGIDYNSVEGYANYINSLGGNVKFVGIKGAGHDVTETVNGFKNPELIEWVMSQERS